MIRPFHPDDLPRLKEITVEAFDGVSIDQSIQDEFGLIHGHNWQWRKGRHIEDDARRDPDGIFVLEQNGEIAGYISTRQDEEAGMGFIPNMALAPPYRGKGWGRKLLQHALQHLRESGLSHVRIETLQQNAVGDHLYRALGFREVARQIHFCAEVEEALSRCASSSSASPSSASMHGSEVQTPLQTNPEQHDVR